MGTRYKSLSQSEKQANMYSLRAQARWKDPNQVHDLMDQFASDQAVKLADLWGIEMVWAHIREHLRQNQPFKTRQEEYKCICKWWREHNNPEYCSKLVMHASNAMQAIIKSKGLPISKTYKPPPNLNVYWD